MMPHLPGTSVRPRGDLKQKHCWHISNISDRDVYISLGTLGIVLQIFCRLWIQRQGSRVAAKHCFLIDMHSQWSTHNQARRWASHSVHCLYKILLTDHRITYCRMISVQSIRSWLFEIDLPLLALSANTKCLKTRCPLWSKSLLSCQISAIMKRNWDNSMWSPKAFLLGSFFYIPGPLDSQILFCRVPVLCRQPPACTIDSSVHFIYSTKLVVRHD